MIRVSGNKENKLYYILAKHKPIDGVPENGMIRVETTDTGQNLWVSKDEIIERKIDKQ